MSPLQAGRPLTGAVRLSVRPVEELARTLDRAGWRVAVVSGGPSKREALDAVAAALAFPAHFGHNLDALWDCLTDLERPTALLWAGWEPLAVREPDAWAALLGVLRARAEVAGEPPFSVVFCVAGDAPAVAGAR
nr:barstar family protein [Propionibacterium sp.]